GGSLQVGVHDNPLLDSQSRLLGERSHRPDADTRHDKIRVQSLPSFEHHAAAREVARLLAEVEDYPVLLVEAADEVAELRTQHALKRTPTGRDHVYIDLPRAERRGDFEPDEA